jgi:hypothetical protein
VRFAARVEIITSDKGVTYFSFKKPLGVHLHHSTVKARKE